MTCWGGCAVKRETFEVIAVALVLATAAGPGYAEPTVRWSGGGATIEISAVSAGAFHLRAAAEGHALPAGRSPFILSQSVAVSARAGSYAGRQFIQAAWGRLVLDRNGHVELRRRGGGDVLWDGAVSFGDNPGSFERAEFSFRARRAPEFHAQSASGGPGANASTRSAFSWSASGWGLVIAGDTPAIQVMANGTQAWYTLRPYLDLYLLSAPDPDSMLATYGRLTGKPSLPPRWSVRFVQLCDANRVSSLAELMRQRQIPGTLVAVRTANSAPVVSAAVPLVFDVNPDNVAAGAVGAEAAAHGWLNLGRLELNLPEVRRWWWRQHSGVAAPAGWIGQVDPATAFYLDLGFAEQSEARPWSLIATTPLAGIQRLGGSTWIDPEESSAGAGELDPGLESGLSGVPFWSAPLGTGAVPDSEALVRQIQRAAVSPFMVGAESLWSRVQALPPDAAASVEAAVRFRERLAPYLYTSMERVHRTGEPLTRPLLLDWPLDPRSQRTADEWMLGRWILAAPIAGAGRSIYLPRGLWYDLATGEALHGPAELQVNASLDTLPVYARAGAVLPFAAPDSDGLEVHLFPGASGEFWLYQDDGVTRRYLNGAASRVPLRWNDLSRIFTIGPTVGAFGQKPLSVRIVMPDGRSHNLFYRGQRLRLKL